MQSKNMMKKTVLRTFFLAALLSTAYAGISSWAQQDGGSDTQTGQQKAYEPAGKFVPTEKLRADDAVAFPVDI